jgi:hypothetical protein
MAAIGKIEAARMPMAHAPLCDFQATAAADAATVASILS